MSDSRREPTDAQWQAARTIRDEISALIPELTDQQLHIIRNSIIAGLMRHQLDSERNCPEKADA